MFKEHSTEEIIDMINGHTKIKQDRDSITIKISKNNYSLEDLMQNLINKLNENIGDLKIYESEIELLKIILENL